jgi:L-arabinose isomerase
VSKDLPRVAVLVPYSHLWVEVVDYDLVAERHALATHVASLLAESADVVTAAAISSRSEGAAAGSAARRAGAECVLVVQTMGTQPAFTLAALAELTHLPVVVWWAQRMRTVPDDFDHAGIVDEGGAVGTPMLTNVLVRRHVPFQLTVGPIDDEGTLERLRDSLVCAAAAIRLRRARIGRVGDPIDGYDCVDADETHLVDKIVGEIVHIEPSEIERRFLAVDDEAVASLDAEVQSTYDVASDVSPDSLARTLRLAITVESLCRDHGLDAGVMNCHTPEIRFGPEVGVTPCFGLGRSTTSGIPWTCAGDLLTVVPMLALKLLGEGCLYHELEAVDLTTGEFVIANTGEHDLALAASGRPALVRNEWFARDRRCGACACYALRPGPAALVGFTQIDDRHRFIVALGEVTNRAWPQLKTVNGSFRFAEGLAGWTQWCQAGVNHHSALTSASAAAKLERLSMFLGAEFVQV